MKDRFWIVKDEENYFEKMLADYFEKNKDRVMDVKFKYNDGVEGLGYSELKDVIKNDGDVFKIKLNSITKKRNCIIHGWDEKEDEIFKMCCLKFGCGNYSEIIKGKYLISKNRQQMYNRLKKLLTLEAVKPWNNVHLDFNSFYLDNDERSSYNRMDFGMKVKFAQSFEAKKEDYEDLEIPYYRR